MNNIKGFLYLTKTDIIRTFRDIRYVVVILILPIIFYLFFVQGAKGDLHGVTVPVYYLIGMSAFSVIGNATNFMGSKLQKERSENWYQFLKVSSIPEIAYSISQCVSYIIISFISIVAIFVVGIVFEGVRLDIFQYFICIAILIVGSFVFIALALVVSRLGSAAHPIGTLLYLMLSFVGGLWLPVEAMPAMMQKVAKTLPSYNYVKIVWDYLGGQHFQGGHVINLLVWLVIFVVAFFLILKFTKSSKCK